MSVLGMAQWNRNLVVTGIPCSGATLVCGLLNRLPDVVVINKPEKLSELVDLKWSNRQHQEVVDSFETIRHALVNRHDEFISKGLSNPFFLFLQPWRKANARLEHASLHEIFEAKRYLPKEFTLAVKWLDPFETWMQEVACQFRCCAVVRNPMGILSEWRNQSGPLQFGRAPEIEKNDRHLTDRLDGAANALDRRLILLDWYFRRFANMPEGSFIHRYEDVVATNGESLAAVLPSAMAIPSLPGTPLENQNSRVHDDLVASTKEFQALVAYDGHACWSLYGMTEVEESVRRRSLKWGQVGGGPAITQKVGDQRQYRPLVDFMVVGAQKCGTTALWEYLREHPQVCMSNPKEVHLFDSPTYDDGWSPREVDRRYIPWFSPNSETRVCGEVTPMYLFVPGVASELKRYNPNLKLIVLLRDPIERTISHYYMQLARGKERASLWIALLSEVWQWWMCATRFGDNSDHLRRSYMARSLYSNQLKNLYRHFPRHRILIISSHQLFSDHQAQMVRVFSFLGVSEDVTISKRIAMSGDMYGRRKHPFLSILLRIGFLPEKWRARALYEL